MNLIKQLTLFFISLLLLPDAVAEDITIFTGSRTGTYLQFGTDIAGVADKAGLHVIISESEGSVDNIEHLEKSTGTALAIVQSDVLGFLKGSHDPRMQRIADRVRLVLPFYDEEVHLFGSKIIRRFEDLQGKRLVIGERGSGNWLTAVNLLQMTGVKPAAILSMSPLKAVTAVLQGDADAMLYVAGKPVPLFTKLGDLRKKPEYAPLFKKVHFIPLDDTIMLREYESGEIGPADYLWIHKKVPTIAVKAVLITLEPVGKKTADYRGRCQAISKLSEVIRNTIGYLKQNGHPKWKEVNLNDNVGTWKLDGCSPKRAGIARH
jgi:TRAP transporter TAXI family solute receptor